MEINNGSNKRQKNSSSSSSTHNNSTNNNVAEIVRTKFLKTASSPNNKPNAGREDTVGGGGDGGGVEYNSTPLTTKSSTPTLAQLAQQPLSSFNFRHSLLYDSGGESGGDADDQQRLIRTPSVRPHKFIIIPATSSPAVIAGNGKGTQRASLRTRPLSNISMKSLTTAVPSNKSDTNLTQTPNEAKYQPHPQSQTHNQTHHQQQLQQQIKQNQHGRQILSRCESKLSTGSSPSTAPPAIFMRSTSQPLSRSDIIHQHSSVPSTLAMSVTPLDNKSDGTSGGAIVTTGAVKFTLYDYETSGAGALAITDTPTIDSPHSTTKALSMMREATTTTTTTRPTTIASAYSSPQNIFKANNDRTNHRSRSTASVHIQIPRTSSESTNNRHFQSNSSGITDNGSNRSNTNNNSTNNNNKDQLNSTNSAGSYIPSDHVPSQIYSDVTSVRSITAIGIGSTDGHKLVIRRVPHTPDELFNLVHPPAPTSPPGFDDDDEDSFMDISDETANLKPRKQHWANKMQFVLACIGYSVGLGNVWRFPYMCYKSGGGVFVVPYCIIMLVCSIPLLFMELSVGQYTGRGPIGALGQLCPLFKGAGLASVVVSFLMSTYYSVIIGYSIYYFFTAFKSDMPWIDCNNRWNTPDCWVPQRKMKNITAPATSRTPSEEFFENKMLQISRGIEYPGLIRWELFACLICAWLMVYFATWKSIKSSAKVRYFTATFPFVLILILMGRAVTLEGADNGLRFFFRPNWSDLKHANVWINAASQNFNSLGITFGSMISFASYNKYNNNIIRDTISVSMVNMITSMLVGVFAFATLGNLALEQNTNVKDVIGDGPGLIFVVYPQAMSKMPYAQLWAVMFFFMLLCLGLNSQFAIVEVVVTSIQDGYPSWIKRHLGYHEVVVLIVCLVSFLFGLPNLIQGGIYFFQLMDHYAASITIVFLAFCQLIAIAWFYGTGRLSQNIKQMTGKAPSFYLKSCWIFLGPSLLFSIWILSLINYHEPTYHNGRYKYPEWAYGIGWMFASFSLICIPGYALINLMRFPGHTFWERLQNTLRPNIYECKICGEHHCEHDYPEQEQYMLAQDMPNMYKPIIIESQHPLGLPLSSAAQSNSGNKRGYNTMHMQTSPSLHHEDQRQQSHQPLNPEVTGPEDILQANQNEQTISSKS